MKNDNRYRKIIGTGGIGKGMLFHSSESETLGRSESRLVTLSEAKDYCKQQIVLHYAAVFLKGHAAVYPIGYVGADEAGAVLTDEMSRDGMDTGFIGRTENYPTMISVCLQYPDQEGCNITAINNAAIKVTPDYILKCMDKIGVDQGAIVAAIPEVPIESRLAMLEYGRALGAFCILSVPAAEAEAFIRANAFRNCNLLAVNEEEAEAILGRKEQGDKLAAELFRYLQKWNEEISLLITCGKNGAYSVTGSAIEYIPTLYSKTINTTGAGDAFLGGVISGIAMGVKLQKGRNDTYFGETKLESAAELGTLCAGMAVESEDSIAQEVTMNNIHKRICKEGWGAEYWFTK